MSAPKALWGGRFTGSVDPLMHEFNRCLPYDWKLYKADIQGSQAYAKALCKAGILNQEEEKQITNGLSQVLEEWNEGRFASQESDEDIHTANERRLSELVGPVAGKLHTGRSRNDQVATDTRLWTIEEVNKLRTWLSQLISVLASRAEKEIDYLMPGYTHLQRAQPIRWSHFLLSHTSALVVDLHRLNSMIPRLSVLPLGSGPLAGNPFAIDRDYLASELGFQTLSINSMQSVADRDFIAEFLFWASMTMLHISRIAEDLIVYSSAEFGFVTLSDAYSTGSSIMPQKKNPDSLELLRGKAGRTCGQLSGLLMTLKGIPSTYNKDLQEDKEPLFDAAETLGKSIRILEGVMSTLTVHPENMHNALTDDLLATDLAEYLVRKGVPFRETHHISGSAVMMAEKQKISIGKLTLEQFKSLSPLFEQDVFKVFDFEASVEKRDVDGGTSRRAVLQQVDKIRHLLSSLD